MSRQTLLANLVAAVQDATPEQVRDELRAGRAQLWLGERSAVLTQLFSAEGARSLHIWSAAGELEEILALLPGGEAWARGMGCTAMTVNTTRGWSRPLRAHGFEERGNELRKVLA